MQKLELDSIGTHLALSIDTDIDSEGFFDGIRERLRIFEEDFSRFNSDNWLSHLNSSRRATLDEDARFMLLFALDIANKTDGYFDPTVGKRLRELWYGILGDEKLEIGHKKVGFWNYKDIEIAWDAVVLHGDIELEFGGVGKWYLIDVIREMVEDFFSEKLRFLIDFWGDMYGLWWWNLGLESPFVPDEVIGKYTLNDVFLACSAPTRRKWNESHHLINPKTGQPATEIIATFIEWPSGILTDSYATALSVMPWELACDTLEKTPHIEGVLVRNNGELYQSRDSLLEMFC